MLLWLPETLASGSEETSPIGELQEFWRFSWYTIFLELLPKGVFTGIGILCLSGEGGTEAGLPLCCIGILCGSGFMGPPQRMEILGDWKPN